MTDESILPGWRCVLEHPDAQLAHAMLENHGVLSQVVPSGLILNNRHTSVWVQDADFSRAEALVREMLDAVDTPTQGLAWTCASCGEENEAPFDICWRCGRDQSGELVAAPEREIADEDGDVAEEDGEGEEEAGPADGLTREPDDELESSDERVLRELEEAGVDLSQPRDIVHFFYVATPVDARAVIASLRQHGFECEEREADSDEAPHPWLILARKHGVADPNSVGQARRLLEMLAAMYHGDYDGWEIDP